MAYITKKTLNKLSIHDKKLRKKKMDNMHYYIAYVLFFIVCSKNSY